MVSSFLVICFESNAYRNIIKRVETARAVSFLCQGLSETCANACEGLSGGRKTNAFQKSAGCWKTRISSSWAPRPGKKQTTKPKTPTQPKKPPTFWEASGLQEKGERSPIPQMTCKARSPLGRAFYPARAPFLRLPRAFPFFSRAVWGWGAPCPPGGRSGVLRGEGGGGPARR